MPACPAPAMRRLLLASARADGREGLRSRGRNVACAHRRSLLHVDNPGGALLELLLEPGQHLALDQVLHELPHDVAMCAENGVLELFVLEELIRFQALPLGEDRVLHHLQAARTCKRLDGLDAAQVRAAQDVGDGQVRKQVHQLVSLLEAFLAERPLAIVTAPVAAAPGLRVPDEIESAQGIQLLNDLRFRLFQTFRHFARASAAATCSIAMSSPAANARRPLTFAPRSHACAVTLSWCSPSTVCSRAAAFAKAAAAAPATGATASAA